MSHDKEILYLPALIVDPPGVYRAHSVGWEDALMAVARMNPHLKVKTKEKVNENESST